MQISITEDEIKAIDFGMEQIREALEGSTNDDYIQLADEGIDRLNNILRKYYLAKEKANELNQAKRYIRSRNGYMPPAKLDKMARLLVKKTKEHENGNTEEKRL